MSLKIILGRAGSGKSTYMLNDMSQNENTIYIVPEQFSFSAEKKLIEAFGVVGLSNPQTLSFMRLADLVFSKYGAPEFISDEASYNMLVSYCANSIKPEKLRLFDGLVKRMSFHGLHQILFQHLSVIKLLLLSFFGLLKKLLMLF